jgi:hypothetical protein
MDTPMPVMYRRSDLQVQRLELPLRAVATGYRRAVIVVVT